ncbi:MAG: L-threonylcarbamoyladenylate synthase [Chloroflexota bacterium]
MKTEQLRARTESSAAESLPRAAALLRAGGLVSFPTETVYGLGANALDPIAIARIFEAKGRPTFDPLIVHIADRADLPLILSPAALNDPRVALLADALWPGPLTIVAPAASRIPGLVRSGLPTVGVRLPDHDLARALIRAAGMPIAAPSANLFGQLSPTTSEHVLEQLDGRIDAVLLGGATRVGVESSVVSLVPGEPARLLRPGGVPRETIAALLAPFGPLLDAPLGGADSSDAPAAAPGMSASHYAPRAPLRIVSLSAPELSELTHVALLAPDNETLVRLRTAAAGLEVVAEAALSESLDPVAAAAKLFELLHRLDASLRDVAPAKAAILTTPYPEPGLGLAIADRLRRAAAAK